MSGVVAITYGLINYQRSSAHQAAYKAFSQLKKMVDATVHENDANSPHDHICFSSEQDKWNAVAVEAQKHLSMHGGSKFGSHLAIIKSNALLRLNKPEEALTSLRTYADHLPATPVKEQVLAQKALMMIDSTDEETIAAGLKELEQIANAGGIASDFAYYWLGQYHWTKGNSHEAKVLWNSMVAENNKIIMNKSTESENLAGPKSPWINKARKLLKTIQ